MRFVDRHDAGQRLAAELKARAFPDPVTPLGPEHARPDAPETYPFGL